MIVFLYIVFGVGLVVFQSACFTLPRVEDRIYDLLVPMIIYLGFFRPVARGFAFVLLFGFIMDNLSEAPFGLYLSVYFWLYTAACWVRGILHVRNTILMPIAIAVGVLIENLVFWGGRMLLGQGPGSTAAVAQMIGFKVLLAAVTGPLIAYCFERIRYRIELKQFEHNGDKSNGSMSME